MAHFHGKKCPDFICINCNNDENETVNLDREVPSTCENNYCPTCKNPHVCHICGYDRSTFCGSTCSRCGRFMCSVCTIRILIPRSQCKH